MKVLPAKRLPADDASYHLIEVPVALRLDIVGESPLQKDCAAEPVGAAGLVLTVTFTALEASV